MQNKRKMKRGGNISFFGSRATEVAISGWSNEAFQNLLTHQPFAQELAKCLEIFRVYDNLKLRIMVR